MKFIKLKLQAYFSMVCSIQGIIVSVCLSSKVISSEKKETGEVCSSISSSGMLFSTLIF